MRTATYCRLGMALILLIVTTPLLAASTEGEVWIRILPPAGSYQPGEQIPVEVSIEDVANLYGAEVRLGFDATHLAVIDSDPSRPGIQVQPRGDLLSPDFVARNEADNQAGTVWYAVTQISPSEPVSGTGALFSFSFETLAPGSGTVTITEQILADPDGVPIPANVAGASYEIEAQVRVCLPLVSKEQRSGTAASHATR